ncbi:glutamyl-tRNA reductase [Subtercola sp. Z020]|uniref:glutamyl-tRNA reductase n=1 Tax=Subtercola sp. Z020 TaxID=2080582 RepID=UPI000CE762ED|nr:glutamyl-tRNA reductase [Subtercola sp. Z020]PPF89704.1 glutamyl-tRNA reductase [Subtercola sp. Z020]
MLICLTASHRNASFTLLEKLSIGAPSVAPTLVSDSDFIQGAVLLATCNRFEAYLDVDDPLTAGSALAAHEVIDAVSRASGVDAGDVFDAVTVLSGDTVAEHLFSVSSGLESVVVGEDEIAGQVKRALNTARVEGTTSSALERLFQRASHTSRDVKTKTGVGGAGRSLVRLALDLAESRVTDWAQTRVLLIGTGKYARVSLTALQERGATDFTVYSPSSRVAPFAARLDIPQVFGDDLVAAVAASDVIVAASQSPVAVLTAADFTAAQTVPDAVQRRLVIDLGLPRNIDPAVSSIAGVELLDLETISLHAPIDEFASTTSARAMVDEAAAEYSAARVESEVTPAVVALRSHFFDALDAEISRARTRGDSSPETEAALRHLVGVLLHTPSVRARELARAGEGASFVGALEALFGVQPAAPAAPVAHLGGTRVAGAASGATAAPAAPVAPVSPSVPPVHPAPPREASAAS